MKSYIGAKIIAAKPMRRGNFFKYYRDSECPEGQDAEERGYLVQYSDTYFSWSPKDVFEEAYRPVNNGEKSLIAEADDSTREED